MTNETGGQVRQSIILAAGNGRRMASDPRCPKPLTLICGQPLLAHALQQAEAVGCEEAVIVVGFGAAAIRQFLETFDIKLRLRVVQNREYQGPNGISLQKAEGVAARRFFLQMADHVFDSHVLHRLTDVDAPSGCVRILVDPEPKLPDLEDATTVRLDGQIVRSIGKGIDPWNAVDAGCFLLDGRIFAALRRAQTIEEPTVSAGMRQLAISAELAAADLGATSWVDVDTSDDVAFAERCLQAAPRLAGE